MTIKELNAAALTLLQSNPDIIAGSLEDIRAAIEANIEDVIPNATTSGAAEFRLLANSLATILWIMANSQKAFKTYVNARTSVYRPPTVRWFYEKVLEFQYDTTSDEMDILEITDEGIIQFANFDEDKQIISAANLTEDTDTGALNIKVATEDASEELEALTTNQKTALGVYVRNIKVPGILINIISQDPDVVKYNLTVYYDPFFTETSIQTAVESALSDFRKSFQFNSKIFDSDFIGLLESVQGVKRVKFTNGLASDLQIKEDGEAYVNLIANELVAGYFNYDVASSITYTDFNDLF